jgi:2,3-bisphosphoglycerate-independent phosphoglycerate mutase
VKYLILLGDGMADWPLPDYDNRTPLEVANTPAIDAVVTRGITGQFCPIPEGLPAGSDIGNLSMFGYDPGAAFRGRAPIEAANQGIHLKDNQVAFRCNLVSLDDAIMKDFTAGHISTEEGAEIIATLNETLGQEFPVHFHTGVSYRHIAVVDASEEASLDNMVRMVCEPPHNISDQAVTPYLPHGDGHALIHRMIVRSQEVLADHPVNQKRIADGKLPANSTWLWGQGKAPEMESYAERFGITGAVISAVDLVMGIGVCAGLDVIRVPGATGWIDTNYEGKVEAGLKALDDHDFVYIHLEAPDETAHQGRADLKIQAIEDFDSRIVAPCLAYHDTHPDLRILVAPDHFTTIETRTHAGGPVPFALCGAGITPDENTAYSERIAATTPINIAKGHTLVERMIRDSTLSL